VLDLLQKPLNY